MAFTLVTLTRTYKTATGGNATGAVVFTPAVPFINEHTVVARPITAQLVAGALSVQVPANTDPGTAPVGTSYLVQEVLDGVAAPRSYYVVVPHDEGSSLPLHYLEQLVGPPELSFPTPGEKGERGEPGVQGEQGEQGEQGPPGVTALAGLEDVTVAGAQVGQVLAVADDSPLTFGLVAPPDLTLVGVRLDSFDGISNIGTVGSTLTVTPGLGNGGIKLITLTAANCAMSFNNGLAESLNSLELVITQDATGGRTITWTETIKWQGGLEPILSTEPGAVDRLIFTSYDGGATWFGDIIGLSYA